jgi:5-methyltetrahydrofolate--homocysteine methyltransferase
MTVVEELHQAIIDGTKSGGELAKRALVEGTAPTKILSQAVMPAMAVVAEKMEAGEYFLPDVLMSIRVTEQAMHLAKSSLPPNHDAISRGKVLIGTIEDDLHSVGKDIVKTMLEAAGFEVIDLGVDVSFHQFVTAAQENRVDIVAVSALLTTTMPAIRKVIKGLEDSGYRNYVKVLVGGSAVTQNFADQIGADGYGDNAAAAVALAKGWVCNDC